MTWSCIEPETLNFCFSSLLCHIEINQWLAVTSQLQVVEETSIPSELPLPNPKSAGIQTMAVVEPETIQMVTDRLCNH